MRILATFLALTLATACADAGIIQPEPEPLRAAAAFDRAMDMPSSMEFFATITFVGTLEPGEARVSPSGIIHATGLVNEWAMHGDLVGPWYFQGGYMLNPKTGTGRSISHPVWFEIEESKWGMTGTFECNVSFKIEGYPDSFTQSGNLAGCHGSGDFEGMHLWSVVNNRAHPGLGGPETIYDFHGVIW